MELLGQTGLLVELSLCAPVAGAVEPDPAAVQKRIEHFRDGSQPAEPVPADYEPMVDFAIMMGTQIYRFDRAASIATDQLLGANLVEGESRLRGWLTIDGGDEVHVVFIGEDGAELGLLYHVAVTDGGVAEFRGVTTEDMANVIALPTRPMELLPLDDELRAQWKGRTAAIGAGWTHYTATANPVLLDIDKGMTDAHEFWVYMLAATTDPDEIVLSGHSAVVVAAVDQSVISIIPYSTGLLVQRKSAAPDGAQLAAMVLFSPLADFPRETHVFTSLLYGMPLYVVTAGGLWVVDGAAISYLGVPGAPPTRSKRSRRKNLP